MAPQRQDSRDRGNRESRKPGNFDMLAPGWGELARQGISAAGGGLPELLP